MIIQRHNTNDIVVILVFAAAFALLFLDVVIIFARGEKKEGFAVSSTSISRDDFRFDITDDLRWQRPVQLAYLRVLRRYPILAEQAAYVKVLISFDRQTGGDEDDTKDPVQRVSNLLEETDEYKSPTQGYAPDAALDSTQTRRFAPLFSQYHSPERFFIYMAIIDAFKLRTQRLPNADEIFDIYEKVISSGVTLDSTNDARALRKTKRRVNTLVVEILERGSGLSAIPRGSRPVVPVPSQSDVYDKVIEEVYAITHGTHPPSYDKALLKERVFASFPATGGCRPDIDTFRTRVRAFLSSLKCGAHNSDCRAPPSASKEGVGAFSPVSYAASSHDGKLVDGGGEEKENFARQSILYHKRQVQKDKMRRCDAIRASPHDPSSEGGTDAVGALVQTRNEMLARDCTV